jgi:transposase-like protein
MFPKTAKFLAQRGATQAEIADCFDVSTRTLKYWITQYRELQEAIEAGNEVFNPRVERALAERALGYSVDVEEWFRSVPGFEN